MTVLQARLYCDYMRRIEAAKTSGQAVRENLQLLAEFFNTSRRVIYSESVDDLLLAAKTLHFTMQQIVLPKFAALSPEPPEPIEKSIFDDLRRGTGRPGGLCGHETARPLADL
ncbi:MAG: hypothetical protein ACLVJ1_10610 [Oscillospiraceae bacterium]